MVAPRARAWTSVRTLAMIAPGLVIVAAFTDDEERAAQLDRVVPFLLARRLVERGARHQAAGLYQHLLTQGERRAQLSEEALQTERRFV